MEIKIKKGNKGKFTKYAKSKGKSVQSAATTILANKGKYSSTLVKRANFAKNAKKWKHEEGGLVEYGLGGTLAGIGSVASTIPTPWTQIGGAALSFIGGLIGNKEEKNAEEERATLERQQRGIAMANSGQASILNPFVPTLAQGGVIPNMEPNVEVEGGEVLQGKDKSLAKVIGPKHKMGGVPLMMENGGRVFSDKIINPDTGRTFAEDAERYMKMMK
jgi:hypothetical protein